MNLDFSDDQKFLQDEARKFFDKEGGLTNTRKVMDESLSHDEALWGKVLELGWTGIRIPEEYDGLGLGHLELCVIAEEIGRALAPIPFSSSVYLFTETIIKYGSDEIKKNILPKLVTGEIVGTYAVAEDMSAITESTLSCAVEGDSVNGVKIAVPDAELATHAVVLVKGSKGPELRLVDLSSDGVEVSLQKNLDKSRSFYKVAFNNAQSSLLGDQGSGWES
ncbi:MAG: acyl-CoA dehydrogenase family protein, partial [Candidatus Neomarinimicrobiota bacterium]